MNFYFWVNGTCKYAAPELKSFTAILLSFAYLSAYMMLSFSVLSQ